MFDILKTIEQFSRQQPAAIALEYGSRTLTYQKLEQASSSIAHNLASRLPPGSPAAIYLPSIPETAISILSLMKGGYPFVPLDTGAPVGVIEKIVGTNRISVILTLREYSGSLSNLDSRIQILFIDDLETADKCSQNRPLPERTDDFCYIYFTSGSTGEPKGVAGSYRGLCHFIGWEIKTFSLDSSLKAGQMTAPTFDPYLRELFVPLCAGGTLCIPAKREMILDRTLFTRWLEDEGITLVHTIPTLFRELFLQISRKSKTALQHILLAGEMLHGRDLREFYARWPEAVTIVNLYGPTETTLAKLYHITTPGDRECLNVPVGRPLDEQVRFHIIDDEGNPCAQGKAGQVYIESPMMSHGYYNKQEATEQLFISNPFADPISRYVYKTGDIGVVLQKGLLECRGRLDNQVKIGGVRIEPGAIEELLCSFPDIERCAVTAGANSMGEKRLRAYFTGHPKTPELLAYLEKNLSPIMIPSALIMLDAMPLLPNGKIDRLSLSPSAGKNLLDDYYIPPQTELQKKTARLWEKLLDIRRAGLKDDFFMLGGHSLKAARLKLNILQKCGVDLSLADIYKHSTLEALTSLMESRDKTAYSPLAKAEPAERYPLSPMQRIMYLAHRINPDDTDYNITRSVRIKGNLDVGLLEECFMQLTGMYDILRSSYHMEEGRLYQKNAAACPVSLEHCFCTAEELEAKSAAFIKPFNLEAGGLLRAALFTLPGREYLLMLDMHHIISDGITGQLLLQILFDLYRGKKRPAPRLQYQDFVIDLLSKSGVLQEALDFWKNIYSTNPQPLNLPGEQTVESQAGDRRGDTIGFTLDSRTEQKLFTYLREQGVTLFIFLKAVFTVLLHKLTGQEDIVIGVPAAGREQEEVQMMPGLFMNTLPLRTILRGNSSFTELLSREQEGFHQALQHQFFSMDDLVRELRLTGSENDNPLFSVMFTLHNMDRADLTLKDLEIQEQYISKKRIKMKQVWDVFHSPKGLFFSCGYSTRLFSPERINRTIGIFKSLITDVLDNRQILVKDMNALGPDYRLVTEDFNGPSDDEYKGKNLAGLFREQAARTPSRICLEWQEQHITYDRLDKMSDYVALSLQKLGCHKEIVAISLAPSPELAAAIWGVLKAGCAYLPVDPALPEERISYMLTDSGAKYIISGTKTGREGKQILFSELCIEQEGKPEGTIEPGDLAYLIYTSGSTGKPKGVMIEHRSVVNFLIAMRKQIRYSPAKRMLGLTTSSFDIFVLEFYLPMLYGGTLVLASAAESADMGLLCRLISEKKVTTLQATPTRIKMLKLYDDTLESLANLEEIILGGEPVETGLVCELQKKEGLCIFNAYGPTETTVWSTIKELTYEKVSTIGVPLDNTQVYILDSYDRPVPIGTPGHLHIGGAGLARGYWQRPEQTAKKFIGNPLKPGTLIYRTGDIAYWQPGGNLNILGRIDNQIKLRGHRIELSEIETIMKESGLVNDAVCLVVPGDNAYLCGYYTGSRTIDKEGLKNFLASKLPAYMVPEEFMHMETFPRTPNGKTDRRSFPLKRRSNKKSLKEKAGNRLEEQIYRAWQKVLDTGSIGIDDNFFDLGGNSFLIVYLQKELEKLSEKISSLDIIQNPTIRKLAAHIDRQSGGKHQLEQLQLPASFFAGSPACGDDFVDIVLQPGKKHLLKELSSHYGCTPVQLMYALLFYNLGAAANINRVPVYFCSGPARIFRITSDFSDLTGFSQFLEQVKTNLESSDYVDPKLENLKKNAYETSWLITEEPGAVPAAADSFDLVVSFEADKRICCDVNNNSINPASLNTFFNGCLDTLETLNKSR